MSKRYQNLLSPLRIGNVLLKNRFLSPNAMPHFIQGPETFPAEGTRAHVTSLAKNGAAVIVISDWSYYPNQRFGPPELDSTHFQAWDLKDPSVLNYYSIMADEVHLYGSKLLVAFEMEYPEGYSLQGGKPAIPIFGDAETKPLPKEMMPEVIANYVKRCMFFRGLGFDGVQVRIDMAMNHPFSERDDEYCGSPLARVKFTLEALAAVRHAMPDFLIEVGMAGTQPNGYFGNNPHGYTLDTTIEFCRQAEGIVDIIELRDKDMPSALPTSYSMKRNEYPTLEFSAAIKEAGIHIITCPTGGFQEPDAMEQALLDGKCDMFGIARAFFCDFEYGKKLQEGRKEDIVPCLKCNRCHGTIRFPNDPYLTVCSVNPEFGQQGYLHRITGSGTKPGKVAIVGGGPAGMRTALYASELGHTVTLFEKTGYLGGQLSHAEHAAFKWTLKDYRDWLVRQLEASDVEIRMNTEATPELITAGGYDIVYAATGAVPQIPASIQGLRDDNGAPLYPTCLEVFGKEAELGHHVVIVGASEVGIDTAMYLVQNGHTVTMLTRQPEIGHNCSKLHGITMTWVKCDGPGGMGHMAPEWEKYEDVLKGITKVTTTSVSGNTVTYVDEDGNAHTVTGDSIVICGGFKPAMDEAMTFAGTADRFFTVGDCGGTCGSLYQCNRDAWAKTKLI